MRLTQVTTFGAVGSAAASLQVASYGDLKGATALGAVAIVLTLVTLRAHGLLPSLPRPTRGTAARASPVFVAVMLVTTVLTGPVAAGPLGFQDCDVSDSLISAGLQSLIGANEEGECRFNPDDADQYENVTQTDVYTTGLAMRDSEDAYLATRSNMAQDVEGVMWMKAKVTIIEELNAGANESEATAAAKATVDNYTTTLVHNHLQESENRAYQIAYMANQTGATPTAGSDAVHAMNTTTKQFVGSTSNVSVELPNGTERVYAVPVYHDTGLDRYHASFVTDSTPAGITLNGTTWADGTLESTVQNNVTVQPVSGDDHVTVRGGGTTYHAPRQSYLENFTSARTQVNANVDAYVNDTYAEYTAGEINTTDLWDPVTLAQEASTSYNDTGYYAFANAELAALGVAGDTNVSHLVRTNWTEVTYDNGTKTTTTHDVNVSGTLFVANSDPSLQLETGTEYDPSNINGTVYMTVSSMTDRSTGNATNYSDGYLEVTENFTVLEATNTKTGEAVNTTTVESNDYDTQNASLLAEQIEHLKDLREEYESTSASGAGGLFGGDASTWILIGAAAAALLMYGGGRSS